MQTAKPLFRARRWRRWLRILRNLVTRPLAFLGVCFVAPLFCFLPGAAVIALAFLLAGRLGDTWLSLAVLLLGILGAIAVYLLGMGGMIDWLARYEQRCGWRPEAEGSPPAGGRSAPLPS